MNKDIVVSVLITYYNQLQYIEDSLTSVLNQKTSFGYEIICGDDGSADGTFEELLCWKEKYPEVISVIQMPRLAGEKYEPIVRVSNCRYALYGKARGKYVIFLDGDDYFTDTDKLETQVTFLQNNASCIAAAHSIKMVWDGHPEKDREICLLDVDATTIMSGKAYWSNLWIHANTFMFRNIYKQNKETINPDFFDDNTIVMNFIRFGNIIYDPRCMAAYRQIEGSSWNRRNPLQRAYVNMYVYYESSRVLRGWKFINMIRSYSDFRTFYLNRNSDIEEITGNQFKYTDKFIEDTKKYYNASIWYRIKYYIIYGIWMHTGPLLNIYRKIVKILIKKGCNKVKK